MSGERGISGDQLILEGLIADILNEHYGEAVELVGIALFRNGSMTFSEIVRLCNLGLLGFPRDSVNRFSQFNCSASHTVAYKLVRDSLLILIHYGIVTSTTGPQHCMYSLNPTEVICRLSLPEFLELFDDPKEKFAMEQVLKRGRMTRSKLIEIAGKGPVESLIAQRALVLLEPISSGVVSYKASELQLTVIKRLLVNYCEAKQDSPSAQVLAALLETVAVSGGSHGKVSIGELSVGDMSKSIHSSTSLISTLIKLQQVGYIAKKQQQQQQSVSPEGGPSSKKRRSTRAPNIKQLMSVEELDKNEDDSTYFENLLGTKDTGGPVYSVRLIDLLDQLESDVCFQLVRAKYGVEAARIFELLSSEGQKLEASHVAEICAISRESALKHLHGLASDGLCEIQEVPKVVSSGSSAAAAGGALSSMMRSVSSSFWLYSTDPTRAKKFFISLVSNAIINLRRRFRCEVNRQCKLEDRACNLTDKEQSYLEKVHAAQDVLEGSAVDLLSSLEILLFKSSLLPSI